MKAEVSPLSRREGKLTLPAITKVLSYLRLPFLLLLVWNTIDRGIVFLTSDFGESYARQALRFSLSAIPAILVVPTLDIVISRHLLKVHGMAVPQEGLGRVFKTKTIAFWRCWIPLILGSVLWAFALVIPGIVFFARRMYYVYFLSLNISDDPIHDSKRLVDQAPRNSYVFAFFSLTSLMGLSYFLLNGPFNSFLGECVTLLIVTAHEFLIFLIEAYLFKSLYTRESPPKVPKVVQGIRPYGRPYSGTSSAEG